MKYYKQVIVKSKDDFPEKGQYFCNRSGFMSVQDLRNDLPEKSFQREIRWYLIEADLRDELIQFSNELKKAIYDGMENKTTWSVDSVIDKYLNDKEK
jgi:hypothetical protein